MSAYKSEQDKCDSAQMVILYSDLTGVAVYAFCQDHQEEWVHPVYAFNLDYLRQTRDYVVKIANDAGRPPRAKIPHSRLMQKVYTSPQSLAEALFQAEVKNE
jgi:hypothetical protein